MLAGFALSATRFHVKARLINAYNGDFRCRLADETVILRHCGLAATRKVLFLCR